MGLPHKGGISVVGLVGPLLGLDEAALYDLAHHHFKGLAVFFESASRKPGSMANTIMSAAALVGTRPRIKKEKRDAYQQRAAKTNELAFRSPNTTLDLTLVKSLGTVT